MALLKILVFTLLLSGCVTTYQGVCRHTALYSAHVMRGQGYETRIVIFSTNKPGVKHAQAQAKIDGRWVYLKSDSGEVYVGEAESTSIEQVVTPEELLSWSKQEIRR